MSPSALEALAVLLEYPGEGFADRVLATEATLEREAPEVRSSVARFVCRVLETPGTELEEVYTRTFDWVPARSLEIGWHLYGEQYERGAFLVRMRDRLREAGLDEGGDLPDHLGTCLRLVARMDAEETGVFVREVLLRALDRLRKGFEGSATDNPYADLVEAIHRALGEVGRATAAPGGRR
jgi:nitrate reductase delta subunit